jgi:hypothetical protein
MSKELSSDIEKEKQKQSRRFDPEAKEFAPKRAEVLATKQRIRNLLDEDGNNE